MPALPANPQPTPAWIEVKPRRITHLPVTLRLRLTFWYSAVLALIIALFGMVIYGGTSWFLIKQIDSSLYSSTQTILNSSHLRNIFDAQQLVIPPLNRFGNLRTYLQAWTV